MWKNERKCDRCVLYRYIKYTVHMLAMERIQRCIFLTKKYVSHGSERGLMDRAWVGVGILMFILYLYIFLTQVELQSYV